MAKVYRELFRRWPNAEHLSRARQNTIATVIRPLGLVRRAATLKALARRVVEVGGVPNTVEGLLDLPGVGRYAAGATAAVAFEKASPVVDGVTARVYRRYFGLGSHTAASADPELWDLVDRASPKNAVREWNWAVLDLAAIVCLPKIPMCEKCPLVSHCTWSRAR